MFRYLNKGDKNINAIIDTATNGGKTMVMVQKFLQGIMKGDKRLIFVGGEIFEYAVRKVATNNDFKFNEHIKENLIKGDLTPEERLDETIFLGFRKREGINVKKINEKFMIDFDKKYEEIVTKFISTGHIEKTENGYRLTISGILISNLILSEFLC